MRYADRAYIVLPMATKYRIQIGPTDQLAWLESQGRVPAGTNGSILDVEAGSFAGDAIAIAVSTKLASLMPAIQRRKLEKMCSVLEATKDPVRPIGPPSLIDGRPVLATVEYLTQLERSWYAIVAGPGGWFEAHSPRGAICGKALTLEGAIAEARADAVGYGGGIGYHDSEA